MSCVIWLHIGILSFGITSVFNQDTEPTTTESTSTTSTTREVTATKATTTEESATEATTESTYIYDYIYDDEYAHVFHEYCIMYDDDCESNHMMMRLRPQKHNISHSKRYFEKSKLFTKLTGNAKPTVGNS